jgi:hypothetical protein
VSDRAPDGKWLPGASYSPATQIKKGQTLNPGGMRKTRRELVNLARESMPRAIERARQLLDDDRADWKAWLEAGKFILSCSAIGAQPGPKGGDDDAPQRDVLDELTVEEVRALARQSLADDAPESDDDAGDDGDETEH